MTGTWGEGRDGVRAVACGLIYRSMRWFEAGSQAAAGGFGGGTGDGSARHGGPSPLLSVCTVSLRCLCLRYWCRQHALAKRVIYLCYCSLFVGAGSMLRTEMVVNFHDLLLRP